MGIFLLAYLIYYNLKISNIRRAEWTRYIERLSSDIDSATKYAVLNLPIPLTIVEFDGTITWYNPKFLDVVDCRDLLEKNIQDVVHNFDLKNILQNENELSELIEINNRYFKVVYNIVKLPREHTSDYIIMIYWIEVTKYKELSKNMKMSKWLWGLSR